MPTLRSTFSAISRMESPDRFSRSIRDLVRRSRTEGRPSCVPALLRSVALLVDYQSNAVQMGPHPEARQS